MTGPVPLTWAPRPDPLPAAAVTAAPDDVPALVAATAERLRAGAELRVAAGRSGAAGTSTCVVLGATQDLPWFPGAVYLGWEGGLLVPTTRRPVPAADLVRAELGPRLPPGCELVVLVPWGVLASRAPARPAGVDGVTALLAGSAPGGGG